MSNYNAGVHSVGPNLIEIEAGGAIQLDNGAAIQDGNGVGRFYVGEKTVTDSGVNLFDVAMPAGAMFGGQLNWTVQASDGTDMQAFSGITVLSSVNKAASFTDVVTSLSTVQAKAVSSGTLTVAVTVADGTNKITIVFTPTGSLTETTYRVSYVFFNNSRQAVTVL